MTDDPTPPSSADHYFATDPATTSAPRQLRVDVPGLDRTLQLTTDRGVFSMRRLDPGTAVLLRSAPKPPATGTFVDVGCGAGAIALALAAHSPAAHVVGVDSNLRAVELCRDNAAANGLGNVTAVGADDLDRLPTTVDLIWSNPPIRIGKAALHALLTDWLERLTPTGQAILVVQKHLGADSLHRWLNESGWPTTRLTSSSGYRLLDVKPRGSSPPG